MSKRFARPRSTSSISVWLNSTVSIIASTRPFHCPRLRLVGQASLTDASYLANHVPVAVTQKPRFLFTPFHTNTCDSAQTPHHMRPERTKSVRKRSVETSPRHHPY